jgi:hypothetical protein
MLLTVDPNEDLVQVPFVTGPWSAPTEIVCEARAKLQTPPPDALIRNKDAALRQEQLDISKAQAEYVVEPDRVADQLRWKTMAIMWGLAAASFLYPCPGSCRPPDPVTVTMPVAHPGSFHGSIATF